MLDPTSEADERKVDETSYQQELKRDMSAAG